MTRKKSAPTDDVAAIDQDTINQLIAAAGGSNDPWSAEQLQAEIDAARLVTGAAEPDADVAPAILAPGPPSVPPTSRPAPAPVPTAVHPVQFQPLTPEPANGAAGHGLDLLQDVQLDVRVELGRALMTIREVLELRNGSVVELDKLAGEPVDVLVNGTLIARGEVVVVDEKFGVRITEVVSRSRRLQSVA